MQNKNLSGKNIKFARILMDMAQKDLCDALFSNHNIKMTQNTLSNIERGKRIVKDEELRAFSGILNVKPSWLLYGEDINNNQEQE